MGEVEPGPAGPLEPPEPPEAPASRRPGGIRVLKVRQAGGQAGCRRGAGGERPRLPSALAEAAGDPPAPRQSVRQSPRGCSAAPQSRWGGRGGKGLRLPARAFAPGPAEASAAGVPSAAHPWPRATPFAGPRRGSSVLPAAAASRLLRDRGPPLPPRPGAGRRTGGSRPRARLAVRRAGCSRTPEGIARAGGGRGDRPGAAGGAGGGGVGSGPPGSAPGLSPPKWRPATPAPPRGARLAARPGAGRESPEEPRLREPLGVLQKGGGAGRKGAFLLAEPAWPSVEMLMGEPLCNRQLAS